MRMDKYEKVIRWIPTSTGCYPDIDYSSEYIEQTVDVLIQLKSGQLEIGWMETNQRDGKRCWRTNCEWFNLSDVVAWMELPKKYEE